MSYQNMINYPHAFYLKYFLNKQMNVLVWNYRGYGRSPGDPEPKNLLADSEQVLHFLKYRIGVTGKIGVYGRSIGATAACHLSPYVDMVIADRGFSDLYSLASSKFSGPIAKEVYKLATCGWQVDNSFSYCFSTIVRSRIKSKNKITELSPRKKKRAFCYKIVMQDKSDEIIPATSSLMFGVSRECVHHHIQHRKMQLAKEGVKVTDDEFGPFSRKDMQDYADVYLSLLDLEDDVSAAVKRLKEQLYDFRMLQITKKNKEKYRKQRMLPETDVDNRPSMIGLANKPANSPAAKLVTSKIAPVSGDIESGSKNQSARNQAYQVNSKRGSVSPLTSPTVNDKGAVSSNKVQDLGTL